MRPCCSVAANIAAERSEEAAHARLHRPPQARHDSGPDGPWPYYDDGVRAARPCHRTGGVLLGVLQAAVADPDASPATRELLALLEIEIAFADPDATVLVSAMQTSRPALAGTCSAHWVEARYGRARTISKRSGRLGGPADGGVSRT